MSGNVGNYIKYLRTSRNMTQEELGSIIGVKKAAVQKWESGMVQNLKRDTIKKLADYFEVSPASFIDDPEPSNISNVIPAENLHMIPVFASVSAGFGAYASDEILEYIPTVLTNPYEANVTLGIKVTGNSMYPKIEDGDTIVVRKQESVDSGSIAVILLDGEEGLVKKVKYGRGWVELHSFNPYYPVRRFEKQETQKITVVGLVKEVCKKL